MEPAVPNTRTRPTFVRAFRPFWFSLVFALVILAWDYNRRHFRETYVGVRVTIAGREAVGGYVLKQGGRLIPPLEPIGIGWKDLEISAVDAEPYFTNCFVRYGGNNLGLIDLERSRGKVELRVTPQPVNYSLSAPHSTYRTPTGFFSNIPAGEYEAEFKYGGNMVERIPVRVVGNQRKQVAVTNRIGSIDLALMGEGGDFVLESVRGDGRWTGALPLSLPFVRSGPYRLQATRGDYQLKWDLVIAPGATNRLEIEFAYGEMEVLTTPSGALVELGGREVGTTPVTLRDLIPGRYSLRITKEGFDPILFDATVEAKATVRLNRVLTNTRYRLAMEQVDRAQRAGRFRDAEQALAEALAAVPGEAAATALVLPIQAAALREQASQLIRAGDLPQALEVLSRSEAIEPGAPELQSLRNEIAGIRKKEERERAEAERRRIEEAERQKAVAVEDALANGNVDRAQERLNTLRGLAPNHQQIPAIEAGIASLKTRLEAENARRLMEEQVSLRRRELVQAVERSARSDEHRPVRTLTWRTSKSAQQVQSACEPKEGKGMDVYDLFARDYLITWRNGRPIPFIGTGVYVRFGAVTLAPGQTEVRALLYNLTLINGRPASDPDEADSTSRARNLHETLKKALGGDLELFSP